MKVVLDVNILVSSALNGTGLPVNLVDLAAKGRYTLVVSEHVMNTLDAVLRRPHIARRVSDAQRKRLMSALTVDEDPATPDPAVRVVAPDLEDDLVLGTAVAANADFLVTGDNGLLELLEYRSVRIVTAAQFLEVLGTEP